MSTREKRSCSSWQNLICHVIMVLSKKKKKKVSTIMPLEKCGCTGCLRLFSLLRVVFLNPTTICIIFLNPSICQNSQKVKPKNRNSEKKG